MLAHPPLPCRLERRRMSAGGVAILLGALLLLGACSAENNTPPPDSESEYVEQKVNERTFNDWTLENVGFEVPISLYDPVFFRIYNDQLFIWDGPVMSVKRYALNGEPEVTYGNGRGQGPGQFQHISSFAARGTEEVWIVDSQAGDISRFRYDGLLVDRFPTAFKPYRMTVVSEDRLVVQQRLEPELFALFNAEGEMLKRFGKVLDVPQDRYSRILDGQLFPNPDGGFVWAPLYASYLYFYSPDGTLTRRIELIDGHRFPVEKMQPNPLQGTVQRPPQLAPRALVGAGEPAPRRQRHPLWERDGGRGEVAVQVGGGRPEVGRLARGQRPAQQRLEYDFERERRHLAAARAPVAVGPAAQHTAGHPAHRSVARPATVVGHLV
mgnify:CR=1 FL=1